MAEPSMLISGLLSFVQGRVKLIFHFWNCWPGRKQILFKNLILNLTNLFVVSFCVYERERDREEEGETQAEGRHSRGGVHVWRLESDLWSQFSVLYRVCPGD